ncbi:SCAN domain-containing protein 3 [Trichinella zimbabwensis]|uniref:SCAN domain-containing protein 3 n=1 Tax=Trichinella zimbabwensis TaxID=268475 RepID=A0A0V1HRB9_9BILA|nr:SCAN domain-containing protein 3 [Trichinella zimbabwensis]
MQYFSNLQKLEEGADVSDRDMEIYINHLEKLRENFKILSFGVINTPKLSAAVQPFLLAFPSSYLVEAGFSHANAILSKQRNRLNEEMRDDLRMKLTNFQPNINALAAAHQTHPSH